MGGPLGRVAIGIGGESRVVADDQAVPTATGLPSVTLGTADRAEAPAPAVTGAAMEAATEASAVLPVMAGVSQLAAPAAPAAGPIVTEGAAQFNGRAPSGLTSRVLME